MGERGLIENLARAAHDAWLEEKLLRGVVSWPNERGVEQMVPYDELHDDVREFDRVVVRALLDEIARMDLAVVDAEFARHAP